MLQSSSLEVLQLRAASCSPTRWPGLTLDFDRESDRIKVGSGHYAIVTLLGPMRAKRGEARKTEYFARCSLKLPYRPFEA